MAAHDPCTACSWTPELQDSCGYRSNVRLFYAVGNRGVWSLGSQRIVKDRSSSPPNFEAENIRFIRANTTIPVPEVVDEWTEGDRYYLITKRIPGIPLSEAWPILSENDRDSIARQTIEYLHQLRALSSTSVQSIDEQPVFSAFLFRNGYGIPHGPLNSDDELWEEMAKGLKDVPRDLQHHLRQRMPPSTPYTFTHGDLTSKNIIVENRKVTGIIDWEGSGYFPAWWESASTGIFDDQEDRSWKDLLRHHMADCEEGLHFWRMYYKLSRWPDVDKGILESLRDYTNVS